MPTPIIEPQLRLGAPDGATYAMLVDQTFVIFSKDELRPIGTGKFLASDPENLAPATKKDLRVLLDGAVIPCTVSNCPGLGGRWLNQPWCVDWGNRIGTKVMREQEAATAVAPPWTGRPDTWVVKTEAGDLQEWRTRDVVFFMEKSAVKPQPDDADSATQSEAESTPGDSSQRKERRALVPSQALIPTGTPETCSPTNCHCKHGKVALCALWADMIRDHGKVLAPADVEEGGSALEKKRQELRDLERQAAEARHKIAELKVDIENRKRLVDAADVLSGLTPKRRRLMSCE